MFQKFRGEIMQKIYLCSVCGNEWVSENLLPCAACGAPTRMVRLVEGQNCPFCNVVIRVNASHCKHCRGQLLRRRCPSCNKRIGASAVRCMYCGNEIQSVPHVPTEKAQVEASVVAAVNSGEGDKAEESQIQETPPPKAAEVVPAEEKSAGGAVPAKLNFGVMMTRKGHDMKKHDAVIFLWIVVFASIFVISPEKLRAIPGPILLGMFALFSAATIYVGWCDGSEDYLEPALEELDAIDVATLRGGWAAAARTAFFRLWLLKFLNVEGQDKDVVMKKNMNAADTQVLSNFDKRLLNFVSKIVGTKPRYLFSDVNFQNSVKENLYPVKKKLKDMHLLMSRGWR